MVARVVVARGSGGGNMAVVGAGGCGGGIVPTGVVKVAMLTGQLHFSAASECRA